MTPISFSRHSPSQNHLGKTTVNNGSTSVQCKSPAAKHPGVMTNIPIVALDIDILTDTIAAQLATSLLSHVLFLKNQIPLLVILFS